MNRNTTLTHNISCHFTLPHNQKVTVFASSKDEKDREKRDDYLWKALQDQAVSSSEKNAWLISSVKHAFNCQRTSKFPNYKSYLEFFLLCSKKLNTAQEQVFRDLLRDDSPGPSRESTHWRLCGLDHLTLGGHELTKELGCSASPWRLLQWQQVRPLWAEAAYRDRTSAATLALKAIVGSDWLNPRVVPLFLLASSAPPFLPLFLKHFSAFGTNDLD